MTGKIMKGIAGFYYVHDRVSKVYECKARGIFRNRKIKPLVGDDVEFTILDERERTGNIVDILDRRNQLARPAVANVDQAVVVFAVADPDPNFNLLDRFLLTMEMERIPAAVCFNKKDLGTEEKISALCTVYEAAGYPVYFTDARSGEGLSEVRDSLRGKTTVLAGPSGVGKSSLTNIIQPEAGMETGAISEKIKRGRHTTRHSELFFVERDTFMMDTPGFGSIYVEKGRPEELSFCFPEFDPFVTECRFPGCVHMGERECGVKTAVKEGKIAKSRYENYRLIYEELKSKRRY